MVVLGTYLTVEHDVFRSLLRIPITITETGRRKDSDTAASVEKSAGGGGAERWWTFKILVVGKE